MLSKKNYLIVKYFLILQFPSIWLYTCLKIYVILSRAVTVADIYHRGGNGPTTAGGAVLCIFKYIILKRKNK